MDEILQETLRIVIEGFARSLPVFAQTFVLATATVFCIAFSILCVKVLARNCQDIFLDVSTWRAFRNPAVEFKFEKPEPDDPDDKDKQDT